MMRKRNTTRKTLKNLTSMTIEECCMNYVKLIVFLLIVYFAVVMCGVVGVYKATGGYTAAPETPHPECTGEVCA